LIVILYYIEFAVTVVTLYTAGLILMS